MPIYEYRCQACGHTLDALQKLNDEPLSQCPECSAEALKRLVSAPAFRLKGGGWYETDFKSDKEKRRNLAEQSKAKDKSEGGGEAKGDKGGKEAKPAGDAAKSKPAEKSSGSKDSASKGAGSKGTGTEAA